MIRSVLCALLLVPVTALADEKPELLAVGSEPPSFTLRTLNPKESGLRRAVLRRTIGKRAKDKSIKLLAIVCTPPGAQAARMRSRCSISGRRSSSRKALRPLWWGRTKAPTARTSSRSGSLRWA